MTNSRDAQHPLLLLTLARFREFSREPSAVFWTFGFPILLTVALGFAFRNQKPGPQAIGLVGDEGRLARTLPESDFKVVTLSEDEALVRLRHAELTLVVRREADGVTYVFDRLRTEAQLARASVDEALQRGLGRTDPLRVREEKVEAAGSRYIDWMVPGLIGVQLMGGSMWGIAFAIVEWRSKKLLKRLVATPMRRSDFLISFVLWRLTFVLIEITVLLLFAHLAFAVPIRGSLAGVFTLCLIGAASFAGIGLLVASRAKNTETANGLVNLVQLPMYLVSGVFFSASRFPAWAQVPIRFLPLTALNDALRGMINEGLGLAGVGLPLLVLAGWGLLSGAVALKIFKWV